MIRHVDQNSRLLLVTRTGGIREIHVLDASGQAQPLMLETQQGWQDVRTSRRTTQAAMVRRYGPDNVVVLPPDVALSMCPAISNVTWSFQMMDDLRIRFPEKARRMELLRTSAMEFKRIAQAEQQRCVELERRRAIQAGKPGDLAGLLEYLARRPSLVMPGHERALARVIRIETRTVPNPDCSKPLPEVTLYLRLHGFAQTPGCVLEYLIPRHSKLTFDRTGFTVGKRLRSRPVLRLEYGD